MYKYTGECDKSINGIGPREREIDSKRDRHRRRHEERNDVRAERNVQMSVSCGKIP